MKAFTKIFAGGNVEEETQRAAMPDFQGAVVRVKPQARKHKVISYGYRVVAPDGTTPPMYKFQYFPDEYNQEELHPGVVPANFQACVPIDGDNIIYFYTREGEAGPEYRTYYCCPDPDGSAVPLYEMAKPESDNPEEQWTTDIDQLWVLTLQQLEEDEMSGLTESSLEFLDADPLFLFGIADPATQRTLERSGVHPMLRCHGKRPCISEWFAYLNADEAADAEYRWVVESFAEVELPQPWTSYKGPGSVVCYLNNETNETEWKHPFYDYFFELINHCRSSTKDEHIKLRINRTLWSYEAESQVDVQNQMPLVSPKYVNNLGEILGVDLVHEPFMVRTIKTFLRAFSQMYHEGELDVQEVKWCLEIVENERTKARVQEKMHNAEEHDPADDLDSPEQGQLHCVDCGLIATCYCPECGDCMCMGCYDKLHMKGNRVTHEPNYFILCTFCKQNIAKLQCTYTRGKYCYDCYMNSHKKTLPKFLDLKPLRIDYRTSRKEFDEANEGEPAPASSPLIPEDRDTFSKAAPLETPLGPKWHAFYDLRGVKYYYNFETQESVRRPQDDLVCPPAEADVETDQRRKDIVDFLAKSKEPRNLPDWEEGKEYGPPPQD